MILSGILGRQARFRGDREAVAFEGMRLSYADFDIRVNRLANAFGDVGIAKGDRVATLLPNCLELLDVYWACAKTGAVAVPLSPLLQRQAIVTCCIRASPGRPWSSRRRRPPMRSTPPART